MALAAYRNIVGQDLLLLEELNGAVKEVTAVGEVETDDPELVCWVPPVLYEPVGCQFPIKPVYTALPAGDALRAAYRNYLSMVYNINYQYLMRTVPSYAGREGAASTVAYIRMISVYEGLANPRIVPNAHHCRYNLCRYYEGMVSELLVTPACWQAGNQAVIAGGVMAGPEPSEAETIAEIANPFGGGAVPFVPAQLPLLNAAQKNLLRKQFVDIVCLVAYIFRTRGHHYKADFNDVYRRLFKSLTHSQDQETPGAEWEEISRHALKCILPGVLDRFWLDSVDLAHCSPQLSLRLNAPCAGTGAIVAIRRGWDDVSAAFPQLEEKFGDALRFLEEQEEVVNGGRWYGGINERFYTGERHAVSERALGPIAAVIRSAIQRFADDAPLAGSKALQRVAQSAPIIGAVVAEILGKVAGHDAMVFAFMPEDVRQLALKQ